MNLIEFKQQLRSGVPFVSINQKGVMCFNKAAVQGLGLNNGDKLTFYQDKDNPVDWYFKVGNEGVPLRSYADANNLLCNFSYVCRKILQGKQKACYRVATKPVDESGMYAILTRS